MRKPGPGHGRDRWLLVAVIGWKGFSGGIFSMPVLSWAFGASFDGERGGS